MFARWQHSYVWVVLVRRDTVVPSGLYARFCHALLVYFFYYEHSYLSIYTGPIFMIFHQMEDIYVNFLDLVQFFRFLKGRCHGNQFCIKITYPLYLSLRMWYRYLNVRVNSANDASISYELWSSNSRENGVIRCLAGVPCALLCILCYSLDCVSMLFWGK